MPQGEEPQVDRHNTRPKRIRVRGHVGPRGEEGRESWRAVQEAGDESASILFLVGPA